MTEPAITYVMAPTREQIEASFLVSEARRAVPKIDSRGLAAIAIDEADRIEGAQRSLIISGARSFPDPGEIRAAAGLWQMFDLLLMISEHDKEFRPIVMRWISERWR
jgi:hypothetical protein